MNEISIIIDTSISDKFNAHMQNHPETLEVVATKVLTSKSHLSRVLNGKRQLTETLRSKLNAYFNTEF